MSIQKFSKYEIGQLFDANMIRWPEASIYNYRKGQHELQIFLNSPAAEEIEAVKSSTCRFAFCEEDDVIFFLYNFELGLPWSDASFSFHMLSESERELPPEDLTPESRVGLSIYLVDASNGVLRAMRSVTLSHEFAQILHTAIKRQAEKIFNQAEYEKQLSSLYERFTPEDLLERSVLTCRGGE